METSKKNVQEIRISVPWGYLAGKAYGEEQDPLVVCTHGIMDNAGSLDRLITYLPNTFYYIAVDLPGHGQSSHFPPHLPIHTLNYLLVYKYISKYYGKKYIILGHSYGGQIGILYAQLYPDCVEKVIMLDTVSIFPVSASYFKDYISGNLEDFVKMEEKLLGKQPPSYTEEEALHKLQNGRNYGPITRAAAVALFPRSVKKVGNDQYQFTLDQRIKHALNLTRDIRYIIETLKSNPLQCPVLFILGKKSTAQQVYLSSLIQYLKKQKNIRFKMVEGNHDVHNNNPERVAPHIVKFLLWKKGKL
nr:serine hydrolase-like protein 2 isoform X1 [Leptinotarsa decemlineata]